MMTKKEFLACIPPDELRILDGDDWIQIWDDTQLIYEGHPDWRPILRAVWPIVTTIEVSFENNGDVTFLSEPKCEST